MKEQRSLSLCGDIRTLGLTYLRKGVYGARVEGRIKNKLIGLA